jgi:hypothetical protein
VPDLPAPLLAVCVTLVVSGVLWAWRAGGVAGSLGDTDDALRLVLVRDLVSGQAGWWDQHFMRLQPPVGMDLHWSRLVDGGLALLDSAFGLFMEPAQAELAMRVAWPLLWLFPAILGPLVSAKRLRGPLAGFLCAVLLAINLVLYAQWAPGRIDHHGVQIALFLLALAGAVRGGAAGGAAAGAATGLGLAVGVEALLFEAIVGAAIALRFLCAPERQRRQAIGYGVALAAVLPVLFLAQTPPARWGVSACDALGVNLVVAAGVAALGLWLVAGLGPRLGPRVRLAALGLADLSNGFAMGQIAYQAAAVAAWAWLGRRRGGRTFAWLLLGLCLAAGVVVETQAQRMAFYVAWVGTPLVAAAVVDLGTERLRGRLVPMVLLLVLVSPITISVLAPRLAPPDAARKAKVKEAGATCFAPAAFRRLAALPPGLVLGEVDLGPYVLVTTPHAVVAAPYHRMAWGILSADAALSAPPQEAWPLVRRLGVRYVVDCPSHSIPERRRHMRPASLQYRLDRGEAPAWLRPLSPADAPLQVYEVAAAPGG